jgi:hypothetical protein
MLSLFVAFMGSNLLYQGRIQSLIQETLIKNGEKIIQTYQSTPSAELIPFMENFSGIAGTRLQLYNQDGMQLLDDQKVHVDHQQC